MPDILLHIALAGLPPTVNHMYRTAPGRARYKTADTRCWQETTALILRRAYGRVAAYTGPVSVGIVYRTGSRRRWDIDNRQKALLDCLAMGGVIKDDSQIYSLHVWRVPCDCSRTELLVQGDAQT